MSTTTRLGSATDLGAAHRSRDYGTKQPKPLDDGQRSSVTKFAAGHSRPDSYPAKPDFALADAHTLQHAILAKVNDDTDKKNIALNHNPQEELAQIKKLFTDDLKQIDTLVSVAKLLGEFKAGTAKYREALESFMNAISQITQISGMLASLMTKQSIMTSKNEETQATKELKQMVQEWAAQKAEEDRPWYERLADIVIDVVEIAANLSSAAGDLAEIVEGDPLALAACAASIVMAVNEGVRAVATAYIWAGGPDAGKLRDLARNGFLPKDAKYALMGVSYLGGVGVLAKVLDNAAKKGSEKLAVDAAENGAADGAEKLADEVEVTVSSDAAEEAGSSGAHASENAAAKSEDTLVESTTEEIAQNVDSSATEAGSSTATNEANQANKEIVEEEENLATKLRAMLEKKLGNQKDKLSKIGEQWKGLSRLEKLGITGKTGTRMMIAPSTDVAGDKSKTDLRAFVVQNQIGIAQDQVDKTSARASQIQQEGNLAVDVTKNLDQAVDELEKSLQEAVVDLRNVMLEIADAVIKTNEDIGSRQLQI